MFEINSSPKPVARSQVPVSEVDSALTAQIVVGWAGETGEQKRLGWWRSDLISTFGGRDLFRRLLPSTGDWAVLQSAREAARRKDVELRRQDHNPDRVVSLFSLGFELDERIDERLQDLKRSGRMPQEALPGLLGSIELVWNRGRFVDWVQSHGEVDTTVTSIGRRIKGDRPAGLDQAVRLLVAALAPLADAYPLPHFKREAERRTARAAEIHTRLLKCALEVDDSRVLGACRRLGPSRCTARVQRILVRRWEPVADRVLLANMRARFDAFPSALETSIAGADVA